MRRIVYIIIMIWMTVSIQAQELKCNVQVISTNIQGTNKSVFQTLQQSIYEFMNTTVWTNHVYGMDERIECTMMLRFDKAEGGIFVGKLQIQSSRPVYGTSYNTVILNIIDNDFQFEYVEHEPIEYSTSTHISNLSSMLAFYAYIILAYDYDTFSPEGGNEFLTIAENIVNNAQNAPEVGWKSADGLDHKNRYWLVKDLQDDDYENIRKFLYQYHRQGLDIMATKTEEGRASISETLNLLQKIYREKPDPYMHPLQILFDGKSDEFVSIFSESSIEEKSRVYKILTEIDPANTNKYDKLKEN